VRGDIIGGAGRGGFARRARAGDGGVVAGGYGLFVRKLIWSRGSEVARWWGSETATGGGVGGRGAELVLLRRGE